LAAWKQGQRANADHASESIKVAAVTKRRCEDTAVLSSREPLTTTPLWQDYVRIRARRWLISGQMLRNANG